MGFPDSSDGQESACNAGDPSSIPGSKRSPGEGKGYPLQYSWASLFTETVKNLPAMWETWVWASLIAQLVKNLPEMQETPVRSLGRKILWRRNRLPTPVFLGFPVDPDGKESACNEGHLGSIPGLGRSPGGQQGNLLQYSCLENPHGQRSLVGYSPWDHKVRHD